MQREIHGEGISIWKSDATDAKQRPSKPKQERRGDGGMGGSFYDEEREEK
jgi:hypothetical protein